MVEIRVSHGCQKNKKKCGGMGNTSLEVVELGEPLPTSIQPVCRLGQLPSPGTAGTEPPKPVETPAPH